MNTNLKNLIKNFFERSLQKLQLIKPDPKIWIKTNEFNLYFRIVLWACNCSEYKKEFNLLNTRIEKFCTKASFSTSFLYFKEVVRIVIKVLASEKPGIGKILVQCDKHGLPTIIPNSLRTHLLTFISKGCLSLTEVSLQQYGDKKLVRNKNQLIVVAILTCLCIYRVFHVKVKPSLKTIVQPFNGKYKTLNSIYLSSAIKSLNIKFDANGVIGKYRIKNIKLLLLETVSPNTKKSTWGSTVDAIAFWFHLDSLNNFVKLNLKFGIKQCWLTLWLFLILALSFPFLLFFYFLRYVYKLLNINFPVDQYQMASLSVVYDQAGKARIVGISNYWVQCLLKPIHDAIFVILKDIPEDGTFDQAKPLQALLSRKRDKNQIFYSFDLSAATDRLPITIQKDIINILFPGIGNLWANLLVDMSYAWKREDKSIKLVKYAVGQPMGAYSSWPMLALTHHVLVKCAAIKAGLQYFKDYAVLGDDIVIANDSVAEEYLKLMTDLGISINLSKSLQSNLFCEFAKRWMGPTVDITPIGPGLILNAVRNKFAIASLITKLKTMNIFTDIVSLSNALNRLPKSFINKGDLKWNAFWSTYGLNLVNQSQFDDASLEDTINWTFSVDEEFKSVTLNRMLVALIATAAAKNLRRFKQLEDTLEFFIFNWWKINVTKLSWVSMWIEVLLRPFSPGFWFYLKSLYLELKDIKEEELLNYRVPTRIKRVTVTKGKTTSVVETEGLVLDALGIKKFLEQKNSPLSNSLDFLTNAEKLRNEIEIGKEIRENFLKEYKPEELPQLDQKLRNLLPLRNEAARSLPFGSFPLKLRDAIMMAKVDLFDGY